MIQQVIQNLPPSVVQFQIGYMYANVASNLTLTPTFNVSVIEGQNVYFVSFPHFLIKLESQQTNKIKYFIPSSVIAGRGTNKYKRFIEFQWKYSVSTQSTEDLAESEVLVGRDDFPLGFYDLTIYETDTSGELDPANATATLYNGILNMTGSDSTDASVNFESVEYTDYNTNDAETESVYITF